MTNARTAEEYLLKRLRDNSEQTLYALAQQGADLDLELTRVLGNQIKKTANHLAKTPIEEISNLAPFSARNKLMRQFIVDEKTPIAIHTIFDHAAGLENLLFPQQPKVVNSMDIHHFAGELDETGAVKINLDGKILSQDLPNIMPYATLLMNPLNPENENDPILPLQPERMENHADVLAQISGDSAEDHLKAAFINVSNIAAWRYNKATAPGQVGFEYFIECAERANDAGGLGLNSKVFKKALEEHTHLTNG